MEKYKVRSKYEKGSKKPYVREIIDKHTNDICHYLTFDHYPSWDEITAEVKRLDSLSDRVEPTNNSNGLKPCPCGNKNVYLKKEPLWHGSHGYHDCYKYIIVCDNPKCRWKFEPLNNDTIYRSDEEAIKNIISAWNDRP